MVQQPIVGQGLLVIETSRSHSDTPHWVGLLWTSDQPYAETSTWQHTTLTRDGHRTHNPSKRTHSLESAAHWDRPSSGLLLRKQLSLYNDYLYCYLTRVNAKLVNTTNLKTVQKICLSKFSVHTKCTQYTAGHHNWCVSLNSGNV